VPVRFPRRTPEKISHGDGAQPGQVGRVIQVPGGDHRPSLGQRQRQEPQLGGQLPGPGHIGAAGAPGQERHRLGHGEHAHRDRLTQLAGFHLVAGDDYLALPGRWHEPGQLIQVDGVVEHHQAPVPGRLQQAPHREPQVF